MKEAMTGLGRALIILFVLLLVMNVGKLFFKDDQKREEVVVDVGGEEQKKEEERLRQSKYDKAYDYEEIYANYNYQTVEEFFGNGFKKIYYENENYTNEYYLYLSIINLTKNNYVVICNSNNSVSEEEVAKKMKELFGNIKYTPVSYTNSDNTMKITYNSEKKTYDITTSKCAGIPIGTGHIETKFLGGKKIEENNEFEIYENAYYVSYKNVEGNLEIVQHKDVYDFSTVVADKVTVTENTYAKFKYTFGINNDNSYYLKTIKRVEN